MEEILKKIFSFLQDCWKRQRYEYRFEIRNGQEEESQIAIAKSIEYEFINSGNTIVVINDSLKLYPKFAAIGPDRVKFTINKNEQDVTSYEYRFESVGTEPIFAGWIDFGGGGTSIVQLYNSTPVLAPEINRLTVIIKQPSTQKQ